MIKGKKTFLLVFSGVVALSVVAIFTFSRGMRENFMVTANLLLPRYDAPPAKPSSNRNSEPGLPPAITNGQQVGAGTETNTPSQKNDNTPADISIYRNDQFGFKFSIPDGWQVIENPHMGPYSYFNLTLEPVTEKTGYLDPVLINIVKPGFVERSFRGLEPDANPIVVDNVKGVKYEYPFEGSYKIDYILPKAQSTFIIGAWKNFDDVFYGLVSSFKFLNGN